jgi:gluconolactonase
MKAKATFVIVWCTWQFAVILGQTPEPEEKFPRNVTITGIPGVIAAGVKWQPVWQGTDNADGIVGTPDGGLLFAQEQANTIRKLDKNDYDHAYVKDTHGAGSAAIDSKGRIIVAQRTCSDRGALKPCLEPTKVAIIYPEKELKVLADNFQGKPLGRLSEAIVDTKGTVYFIPQEGGAYYVKPGGQVMRVDDEKINTTHVTGIMLSPDEKTFYAGTGSDIFAFDIHPDGTIGNGRHFGIVENGNGNSMAIDAAGRLYVTVGVSGLQVFSPDGKHLGAIPTPRNVGSAAFSGPDKKMLYIVGIGALMPNGTEIALAPGLRLSTKTIYKIPMLAQGYLGRAK